MEFINLYKSLIVHSIDRNSKLASYNLKSRNFECLLAEFIRFHDFLAVSRRESDICDSFRRNKGDTPFHESFEFLLVIYKLPTKH